jgi:mono/diheme cytochrome c family protein
MTTVFSLLIFFAVLVGNPQVDGDEEGIAISLQKAPPKMLSLKNPYAGNSEEAGKARLKLSRRHCASCHETNIAAKNSARSLNTVAIRAIPAGYLFWFLKNGNIRRGMPAWSRLPDERLWQLVTYIKEVESNQAVASEKIH